jgi:hypothetical protein
MAHDESDHRYVNNESLENNLARLGELLESGETIIKTLMKEKEYAEAELKKTREENYAMRGKICSHERTSLNELGMRISLQEDHKFLREENAKLRKKLGMEPKKMGAGCGHTETSEEKEKEILAAHEKFLELLKNACTTIGSEDMWSKLTKHTK